MAGQTDAADADGRRKQCSNTPTAATRSGDSPTVLKPSTTSRLEWGTRLHGRRGGGDINGDIGFYAKIAPKR